MDTAEAGPAALRYDVMVLEMKKSKYTLAPKQEATKCNFGSTTPLEDSCCAVISSLCTFEWFDWPQFHQPLVLWPALGRPFYTFVCLHSVDIAPVRWYR